MPDRRMDDRAARRIAEARGANDSFSKRADNAARNNKDKPRGGSDGSWRKDDSKQQKGGSSKQK